MKEQVTAWFSCKKHKPKRAGWYEWNVMKSEKFQTVWRQWYENGLWYATNTPGTVPYHPSEQKIGYWRGIAK